jgi:hypothetical protein
MIVPIEATRSAEAEQFKEKQHQLQVKNMQDQLSSDVQYKEMFGGAELEIKRHFRLRRVTAPSETPANINVESQEDVQALGEILEEEVKSAAAVEEVKTPTQAASPEKKEEPTEEEKPAQIPFPEGFLCTRGAFKDAKHGPIAFGRTQSRPRDTSGYQFGQMQSTSKYQPKSRDRAYVPMLLDYLVCRISHKRKTSAPSFAATPTGQTVQLQTDKDEKWALVKQYYNVNLREDVGRLKRPLVDSQKRRRLSVLIKNDHLTVRAVHSNMLERLVYA